MSSVSAAGVTRLLTRVVTGSNSRRWTSHARMPLPPTFSLSICPSFERTGKPSDQEPALVKASAAEGPSIRSDMSWTLPKAEHREIVKVLSTNGSSSSSSVSLRHVAKEICSRGKQEAILRFIEG